MLSDIRDIFDRRPTVDRLTSAVIVADLHEMPTACWSEWRGPRDDQTPRRLSPGELARMLLAIRHPPQDDLAAATRHTRPVSEGLPSASSSRRHGQPTAKAHRHSTAMSGTWTSAMGKYERDDKDLYPTPPWVVDALAEHLDIRGKIIWERTVGTGQMTEALKVTGVAPGTYNRSPYEREVKAALTLWSRACISARRGARKQGRAAARMKSTARAGVGRTRFRPDQVHRSDPHGPGCGQ